MNRIRRGRGDRGDVFLLRDELISRSSLASCSSSSQSANWPWDLALASAASAMASSTASGVRSRHGRDRQICFADAEAGRR